MVLDKYDPVAFFEVWNPRWHDRKALLMANKVGTHNKIVFPKSKALAGMWYGSGAMIKKCPKKQFVSKRGVPYYMYEVPLDNLEVLEYSKQSKYV